MKKYLLSLICLGVILGCVVTAVSLSMMSSRSKKPESDNSLLTLEDPVNNTPAASGSAAPAKPEQTAEQPLINPSTKLIFESLYKSNNQTRVSEQAPPYFLLGLPQDKIQAYYPDWDIVQFDESTVKLRRTVPAGSVDIYVLGVKDNYVAVYQKSDNGSVRLKEITATPIGALSPDEQNKLISGINVQNDVQLAQMLEDYGS